MEGGELQRRGRQWHAMARADCFNLDLAAQVVPALTTIRVPRYELGRRAGEMICERLANREVSAQIADVGFELVERASA